jgi:hypothetical protein
LFISVLPFKGLAVLFYFGWYRLKQNKSKADLIILCEFLIYTIFTFSKPATLMFYIRIPLAWRSLFLLVVFFIISYSLIAQSPVLQVTNSFTQQSVLYNRDSFLHTAWKPVLYTDSTYQKSNRSWVYRKFFEEHLLQVQQPGFNIFGDVVFDEYIGSTKRAVPTGASSGQNDDKSKTIYMNTRGYDFSGNIGDKFYFQTDLYENQGRFRVM